MKSHLHKSKKIFEIQKIKKWTEEEDKILKKMTFQKNRKNWKNISKFLPGKSCLDCMARYRMTCFNHGRWTPEEDQNLIKFHNLLGNNWATISRLIKVRYWKQIRDRYTNHLDPDISKKTFSHEEDETVFKKYPILGTRWSLYTKYIPKRTADQIKNRFNSTIKRKIQSLYTSSSSVRNKSYKILIFRQTLRNFNSKNFVNFLFLMG